MLVLIYEDIYIHITIQIIATASLEIIVAPGLVSNEAQFP